MKLINIREANEADISQLTPLLGQLFDIEGYTPPLGGMRKAFNKMLSDARNGLVVVAENDEGIAAMVTVQTIWDFKTGEQVGLLEDNIVRDGLRRTGIGAQMESFAMQQAAARNLVRVWLVAMDGLTPDKINTQAVNFYKKHGWQQGTELAWYGALPEPEGEVSKRFEESYEFDLSVLPENIRRAKDVDLDSLVALAQYGDTLRAALAQVLNNPREGNIFIEEDDGEIVGWTTVQYRISTGTGGWAALIQNHYVADGHSAAHMNDSIARLAAQHGFAGISMMADIGTQLNGEVWKNGPSHMRVWDKQTPQET